MVIMTDLPVEILRVVFNALADIDLRSLFVTRSTCKTIQQIATDAIHSVSSSHGFALHAFLTSHFSPILDSSVAGPDYQPTTTEGYAPFFALPWASNETTREKYLSEEASWRQIPLVSANGHPVRRLQVIIQSQRFGEVYSLKGGQVCFRMIEEEGAERFQFPQGLSLGLFYDMLLGHRAQLSGGWKLLQETRVSEPAKFEKLRMSLINGDTVSNDAEVASLFTHDPYHALLLLIGKPDEGFGRNGNEDWKPFPIDADHSFIWQFHYAPRDE